MEINLLLSYSSIHKKSYFVQKNRSWCKEIQIHIIHLYGYWNTFFLHNGFFIGKKNVQDRIFLAPIDITTIFGNLLDNAIEAAEKLEGGKYISIKIGSYHKMIAASIENNCGEVKWKNGFPVSAKGKGGGIGLLNVQSSVKKYDGNLILKSDGNIFPAFKLLCSLNRIIQ